MKLIAVKKISKQLPAGAAFELADRPGRMLVLLGLARSVEDGAATSPRRGGARRRELRAEA